MFIPFFFARVKTAVHLFQRVVENTQVTRMAIHRDYDFSSSLTLQNNDTSSELSVFQFIQ